MNFIKKIIIKNYFSIKNEVVVDFSSCSYTIQQHKSRTIEVENKHYNKILAFYGANASGKTTILKAIVNIAYIISKRTTSFASAFQNIYSDKECPSFISLNFIYNEQNFTYEITFQKRTDKIIGIENETLKLDDTILIDRTKRIFNDKNGNDLGNILYEKISNKKSLITETLTRTDDYSGIVDFFENIVMLTNISSSYGHHGLADEIMSKLFLSEVLNIDENEDKIRNLTNNEKKELKNFIINFMSQTGFDITDIDIKKSKEHTNFPFELFVKHKINGKKNLNFDLESSGTKMFIRILASIYIIFKKGGILVIDELDTIIHPLLVPIINMLIIENNIQILYTTHNIYNMQYLNKDELFFIEKNEQHVTNIVDIKNKTEYIGYENFLALYEEGEFGALPLIKKLNFNIAQLVK